MSSKIAVIERTDHATSNFDGPVRAIWLVSKAQAKLFSTE